MALVSLQFTDRAPAFSIKILDAGPAILGPRLPPTRRTQIWSSRSLIEVRRATLQGGECVCELMLQPA